MSLTKEILRITARYQPLGYVQLYEYLYEETIYGKKLNKRSVSTILSRLKKNGLLKDKNGVFSPTPGGKAFLEETNTGIKKFFKPENIIGNREKPRKLIAI